MKSLKIKRNIVTKIRQYYSLKQSAKDFMKKGDLTAYIEKLSEANKLRRNVNVELQQIPLVNNN
jgi:hypothetical protein